jgi:hypothetical protein
MVKLRLRYWIDGKPLDDLSRPLPPGKAWIPTVHFTEKDHEVILNPFCVSSDEAYSSGLVSKAPKELHDDSKSGGQHSFAACLSQPMATFQSAFLASQLGEYLIAFGFLSKDPAKKVVPEHQALKQVRKLTSKHDFEAAKTADELEESKEEAKKEGEEPLEEADAQPDLPKFEVMVNSASSGQTLVDDGDSS